MTIQRARDEQKAEIPRDPADFRQQIALEFAGSSKRRKKKIAAFFLRVDHRHSWGWISDVLDITPKTAEKWHDEVRQSLQNMRLFLDA